MPYPAWAGSSVRLVYCTDQINVATRWTKTIIGFNQTTDVIVETWGDNAFPQPAVEPGFVQRPSAEASAAPGITRFLPEYRLERAVLRWYERDVHGCSARKRLGEV